VPNQLCLVVLDQRNDEYLGDVVRSMRRFVPDADIAWYDSGAQMRTPPHGVPRLACSRPLAYGKSTPFFLDMLEWAAESEYHWVVNVETDMAFVRPGFASFVAQALRAADYLASHLRRDTPATSRWRPYRSLKRELPELLAILGTASTHGCFSPGQVFSRRYARALVASRLYPRLRAFVAANQHPDASFALEEILLPTLSDALGLCSVGYPESATRFNRYRPYHAAASVKRAASDPGVHFVHPIRRDPQDGARQVVRALCGAEAA
jgi:hypothetical protein